MKILKKNEDLGHSCVFCFPFLQNFSRHLWIVLLFYLQLQDFTKFLSTYHTAAMINYQHNDASLATVGNVRHPIPTKKMSDIQSVG